MTGTQGREVSPGALASGVQRTKSTGPSRAPVRGPARAHELKLEGEASPGLADSQGRDPWRTAGWRKEAPAPGPCFCQARALEPKPAGEASLGLVDSQAWAPQDTAGWRKVAPAPGPARGPGYSWAL
ncbi:hypothetical protein NDU88_006827 [Pleurodeles waltl]|uniref:Uncharacterized protein n=1 Tax=Pleurodeles waltl TaxID=8319 RepID=A0AAV7PNI5_PLEWA|nr:hypothetical protein NDU88_006827 [Pleurodeles waltl]